MLILFYEKLFSTYQNLLAIVHNENAMQRILRCRSGWHARR